MAITYNSSDEVVKVKHVLSLAEHIAEKIDGSSSSSKATQTFTAAKTEYSVASEFVEMLSFQKGVASVLTYNGDGDLHRCIRKLRRPRSLLRLKSASRQLLTTKPRLWTSPLRFKN